MFQNVSLTYDDEIPIDGSKVVYALKNINLNIVKGEKIAFVGRTGSGKTSLLNVLFRLYENQTGKIHINGMDVY